MGLTGNSGTQRLKSQSKPIPTHWQCVTIELVLVLDITSLLKRARTAPGEWKQTASPVASLAQKTHQPFQTLILGNSSQLFKSQGGQACSDIIHKANKSFEVSPHPRKPILGATIIVFN